MERMRQNNASGNRGDCSGELGEIRHKGKTYFFLWFVLLHEFDRVCFVLPNDED